MSVFVPHIEVLALISGRLLTKRSRFSNCAKFGYDAMSRIEGRKMDTKAFQNRCVEKDVTIMNLHSNSVVLSAFLASFSFLDPWGILSARSQCRKHNSRGLNIFHIVISVAEDRIFNCNLRGHRKALVFLYSRLL